LINIHTHHLSENKNHIIDIYNQYPWNFINNNSFYSIGIHPIFINTDNINTDLDEITTHLNDNKCVAIGEIGLDKLIAVDFNLQQNVFKQQLIIADQFKKPVIIHCVRAYQEILQIRKEMNLAIPFIFHGFNKNEQLLQQILSNNCYPSFGKNLLNNPNLQAIFAKISDDNFFLENDDSQISIETIYQKAAELKNTTTEEIVSITNHNFNRIFKQSIV